jgi:hypothetical protein
LADTCAHLGDLAAETAPSGPDFSECTLTGSSWLHLRRCVECGHIGCCENSPNRHATKPVHGTEHPLIQSYEPGEDWLWCYVDELMFEVPGRSPSPSHP